MEIDWSKGIPVNIGPWQFGLTEPSPETEGYWEGVARDELRVKRCEGCEKVHHPRRILCWVCGSTEFQWLTAAGTGEIYTFSTIYRAPDPAFQDDLPYSVGIALLDEAVPLFTRFVHNAGESALRVGARVRVEFQVIRETRLPVMRVIDGS